MQSNGLVLDGLVEVLDQLGSKQGWDGDGLLMRAEADSVGVLELDGRHPREILTGQVAPAEWLALGMVFWGWASPPDEGRPSAHPDRQRARTVLAVDRSGRLVARTHIRGRDELGEVPEGLLVDCLQRVFGLDTAAPSVGTDVLFASNWLGDIVAFAGRAGRRLRWHEVAGLHPAARMLASAGAELGPDALVPSARALAKVCGWEEVRRQCIEKSWLAEAVSPAEASWMDAGMLSRWLLGGLPSLAELVGKVARVTEDGTGRRVRRTLRQLGLLDRDGDTATGPLPPAA